MWWRLRLSGVGAGIPAISSAVIDCTANFLGSTPGPDPAPELIAVTPAVYCKIALIVTNESLEHQGFIIDPLIIQGPGDIT